MPTGTHGPFVEAPGDWIGPYRLLSILGEGGMGVVYLAEQARPIRRSVALKIVKPGMDSKQVLARFGTEQQALAMMDHRHIARVYDAGLAPSGRPYFVMEHINGIPITEHCDQHRLTIEQRLGLFLCVCDAVQHAHQKGIIHRDLKPSNVLVIIEHQAVVPKVIDFGVARAISQPLTQRTLFTEQGQLIGTPEYMSPEQADSDNQDIDTRTDVYSLGVLLYELLTGCIPFAREDLRAKGCGEMQRIICEQDPVKPSTKLKTLGSKSEDVAIHCGATPDQLRRSVRGDLDWIAMKCLEKDRRRRYQTVTQLETDIKCYLNDGPIMARPAGGLYRFRKLVRRNKGVFIAAGAVVAVLVLGVIVSTRQAVRATRAEREQNRLRREAVAAHEKEAELRLQAQAEAYASDMSLAQQALNMNDLGRAKRLLEAHRPGPGEVDLRGWEWRYLWQECRSNALGELCRYPNSSYSVAYSPDGKMLAVAGMMQNFVDIWDVSGGKRIKPLQANEGSRVAFSPRGDLLATDAGRQIRLWQTGTWDLLAQLTLAGSIHALRFSRDGTRLASLSAPDELTVWEVNSRTMIRQVPGIRPERHQGALDFSSDGQALVVGDADHRLRVFDLARGETSLDLQHAHSDGITAVAWSPNGSVIASGSRRSEGPIRLWDAASGTLLGTLEGHTSWICELIFSTDGQRLYSASADQTIRIWKVGQRRCLTTLRGSADEVYGLALSPDGGTLASASKDGVVALWNASPDSEEEQPRRITLGQSAQPAFAPDSRVLAVPRYGTVRLFDLATSEEFDRIPELGTDVASVAYSPDGTLLVSGGDSGKLRVWSGAEHRLLRELDALDARVPLLRFHADGRRLLSRDATGKTIWWDTRTWQAVQTFVAEAGSGYAAAFSPDGRLLTLGGPAGAMQWLDAETGELLAMGSGAHRHTVRGIAFSRDGSRTLSVAADGTVVTWDPCSFRPIDSFKGHMQGAHAVAFSPDGRRFATGGGSRQAVKLWGLSTPTPRELMTLPGRGSVFCYVAFSADGRWLAACGMEGELNLWRAASWEEIQAVEKRSERRQSH